MQLTAPIMTPRQLAARDLLMPISTLAASAAMTGWWRLSQGMLVSNADLVAQHGHPAGMAWLRELFERAVAGARLVAPEHRTKFVGLEQAWDAVAVLVASLGADRTPHEVAPTLDAFGVALRAASVPIWTAARILDPTLAATP